MIGWQNKDERVMAECGIHSRFVAFLTRRGRSDCFNLVGGDPDVDLPEALFPNVFRGSQESYGRRIGRIDSDAQQIVSIAGAAVLPRPSDADRVLGHPTEALTQFLSRLVKLLRLYVRAVIIVQR